jgi:ketosteroid isomerase-like protein
MPLMEATMRIKLLVALALLVVVAGCTTSPAQESAGASSPSPPSLDRTVTEDDGVQVTDDYFAAYDADDIDAMMELFSPDGQVLFLDGETPLEFWRLLHEWKVAEGTEMLPRDCTTEEVDDRDAVAVDCDYGQQEYLSRAVDGPAVPHTMTMVVGADGIDLLEVSFGEPSFNVYAEPFYAWMQAHHPEDAEVVGCCDWDSVEDAREKGALVAPYADEWAAWLEEHPNCTWRDTVCQSDGA